MRNDHQASIENTRRIIELDPSFSTAYEHLGLSYLKQERNVEAISNLEKAVELGKRASIALMNLGYAYGVTGKRSEANAIAKELEEKHARKEANAMYVAGAYAGLGEEDKAFEWLEKGFQAKEELGVIRFRIPYESIRETRDIKIC